MNSIRTVRHQKEVTVIGRKALAMKHWHKTKNEKEKQFYGENSGIEAVA